MPGRYEEHLFSRKTSRAAGIGMKIQHESHDALSISSAKVSSIVKRDGNAGEKSKRRWMYKKDDEDDMNNPKWSCHVERCP